ncbi:indole-3-glycerol phosphate synthase TrpC [uncultured Eubacterium sp.]|uniref:indole-3-glycerol phosphate synthase TrpC n=1 Tax=uncultured Eubacterium sp. TaxID=165185 RepID=UPI0025944F1B|nr:indole-3-glycerol phosphate synthase TrpC [uncultured Eubacterium sp.]
MILETIANNNIKIVNEKKNVISIDEIKNKANSYVNKLKEYSFEENLKKSNMGFICECKKASPSKGIIAEDFPYVDIAKEYEKAGADCISVLTEPKWFLGKDEYLTEIKSEVNIPLLRKDFVVDEYMIYEAKAIGADAVLLICSILDDYRLSEYFKIADSLGLSVLVETHDEKEIEMANKIGARIIGVNNRNLKTFDVNINNANNLRKYVSNDTIFVAESGIKDANDIKKLYDINVNAVLIGETLMRAEDKKQMLSELKSLI